jgi:Na+-translocating ferredoxin:NAD+ oxidoreductase RNF subunit RnfB
MTTFQVLATVGFLAALTAVYGAQFKTWLAALTPPKPEPTPAAAAEMLVDDMVTVAQLRERLADIGCTDGVDACTVLLRVMVEYKYPRG